MAPLFHHSNFVIDFVFLHFFTDASIPILILSAGWFVFDVHIQLYWWRQMISIDNLIHFHLRSTNRFFCARFSSIACCYFDIIGEFRLSQLILTLISNNWIRFQMKLFGIRIPQIQNSTIYCRCVCPCVSVCECECVTDQYLVIQWDFLRCSNSTKAIPRLSTLPQPPSSPSPCPSLSPPPVPLSLTCVIFIAVMLTRWKRSPQCGNNRKYCHILAPCKSELYSTLISSPPPLPRVS